MRRAPVWRGAPIGLLGALALLAAGAHAAPRPDLLPPGHAQVEHVLIFEELELPVGQALVATPTRGFGGVEVIEPDVPFSFSSKYGTRLYLLPDTLDVEPPSAGGLLDYPSAAPPVAQVSSVPLIHATRRVETVLALNGIDGSTLELRVVGETRFDSSGQPVSVDSYLPWILLALLGMGAVWRLRRQRGATVPA